MLHSGAQQTVKEWIWTGCEKVWILLVTTTKSIVQKNTINLCRSQPDSSQRSPICKCRPTYRLGLVVGLYHAWKCTAEFAKNWLRRQKCGGFCTLLYWLLQWAKYSKLPDDSPSVFDVSIVSRFGQLAGRVRAYRRIRLHYITSHYRFFKVA